MNDPRGSLWRKWDLHFHTPSSFDYQNKGITNVAIIDGLKKAGIGAVAITDHHFMDFARILELKELAGEDITIFPGIEFRSELGGKDSIHFIGIFPEDCDPEHVWLQIQVPLKLTRKDIEARGGDDAIYVKMEEAAAIVHKNNGLISVHAGKKSNSIEIIRNSDLYKRTQKNDLVQGSVDIFEVAGPVDAEEYRNIVFPNIGRTFPLVTCSDNHNIEQYPTHHNCWIKADTTFRGLKQILCEPDARISISEKPQKIELVEGNKTKYIRSVTIRKIKDSTHEEKWFENVRLTFNHDLIAVIGNKGSGKSALVDVLGHICNSKSHEHFSFLNPQRFKSPQNNIAPHFEAKVEWESDITSTKILGCEPSIEDVELAKYIPQGLFEDICNEPPSGNESNFDKELKKVIYSHVANADRLGQHSLDELIAYKTQETESAIQILKGELRKINEEIVQLEMEGTDEYRNQIKNQLDQKRAELAAHEKSKPIEISEPRNELKGDMLKISQAIDSCRTQLTQRRSEILAAESEQKDAAALLVITTKLLRKIDNFKKQFDTFQVDSQADLQSLNLKFEDIVTLRIDTSTIDQKRKVIDQQRSKADQVLNTADTTSSTYKARQLEKEIADLQAKLDEPNKRYREYQNALWEWEQRRLSIIGDETTTDSIIHFEARLKAAGMAKTKLANALSQRNGLVKRIFAEVQKLAHEYKRLYEPVQRFIESHPIAKDRFALNFAVSIINVDFHLKFFDWIGRNVVGSFYGQIPGEKLLKTILERHNFNSENGVSEYLDDLYDHLVHNKNEPNAQKANLKITDQLKLHKTLQSLYDFIYSLDYLRPRYVMKMGDRELSQLSPGEKGALLLVFYLLVDKNDVPLIIDQPEENLDNQTVYELLVRSIKEAKQRRQIVIVTHNPNLAVVCDAEQVICASLDIKDLNCLTYQSGSIENPLVNRKIVDILEGTMPAFDNRGAKYQPV
jgi:ABC-type lipoprotein export system ATPase subunit